MRRSEYDAAKKTYEDIREEYAKAKAGSDHVMNYDRGYESTLNPTDRITALETHPSWKAHDMKASASLDTMSEGFASMEMTGGFDAAGRTEAGQCRHASRYWESVSNEASARFAPEAPMSDAQATAEARKVASGYFRHP